MPLAPVWCFTQLSQTLHCCQHFRGKKTQRCEGGTCLGSPGGQQKVGFESRSYVLSIPCGLLSLCPCMGQAHLWQVKLLELTLLSFR